MTIDTDVSLLLAPNIVKCPQSAPALPSFRYETGLFSFRGIFRLLDRARQRADECGQLIALLVGQVEAGGAVARVPRRNGLCLARIAQTQFVGTGSPDERCQRRSLGLPSEAGNGPVVGTVVRVAAEVRVGVTEDAHPCLRGRVRLHIREDGGVGDRFDEPGAKCRRRDTENNVRIASVGRKRVSGRQEVRLSDIATGGVASPCDDKQVVHAAIIGSVRIPLKAGLADGTSLRDEPGHDIFCPIESGNSDQRIPRRARSTGGRLRVAGQALV